MDMSKSIFLTVITLMSMASAQDRSSGLFYINIDNHEMTVNKACDIADIEIIDENKAIIPGLSKQEARWATHCRPFFMYHWRMPESTITGVFTNEESSFAPEHGLVLLVDPEGGVTAVTRRKNLWENDDAFVSWIRRVRNVTRPRE